MKLACNIDRRGARARLIGGSVAGLIGIALGVSAWYTGISWLWWPTAGFCCASCVMMFEGFNGWCVLRAMGIKTRM